MLFQGDPIRFDLPKFHMPMSNAYFGKQFEIEKLSEGIYYSLKQELADLKKEIVTTINILKKFYDLSTGKEKINPINKLRN